MTCSHAGPIPADGSLVLAINVNVGPASDFPADVDVVKNCANVETQGNGNPQNNRDCDEVIVHGKQCIQPPSGMVAWWPLDETTGILADDIANVNDGTHINGPVPTAGKVAGALTFDGSNDYVQVPDHPTLNYSRSVAGTAIGDFSIDARIFMKEASNVRVIVDKRQQVANGLRGYTFFLRNGLLALTLADGTGTTSDSGFAVTPNAWHLVAVTVDRDVTDGNLFSADGALWDHRNYCAVPVLGGNVLTGLVRTPISASNLVATSPSAPMMCC